MELKIISKGIEYICLYDDADHELVSKYTWHLGNKKCAHAYAVVNGKRTVVLMHRIILQLIDSNIHTDHKNHNRLDNRRANLRTCTKAQNNKNRSASKMGSSKYLGVALAKVTCRGKVYTYYRAKIKSNGVNMHIGTFKNEEDAARAYDKAALLHHGEFANPNFK